ncbi:MAG: adenylate/guanylate cyclase domain-containing protein [SAR324 cluster bacterium]|nr:adenylate/guanylate cyclase domain-containing protein [SAR324 cluster bacterium]
MLWGFYFGSLLIIGVFNFFMFFAIRDKTYLFYVLYLVFLLTESTLLNGFFSELLIWNDLYYTHRIFLEITILTCLFVLLFSKHFLETARYAPKWDKGIKTMIILCLGGMVTLWFTSYRESLILLMVVIPAGAYFLLSAGVHCLRQPESGIASKYFVIAWITLLASTPPFILRYVGWVKTSFFTEYCIYMGAFLEVLILSVGLAHRMRILKEEREMALQLQLEESQRLVRMSDIFRKFVPHDFVKYLNKSSITEVNLGDGVQRNMTILFSDIRGFTTISETMEPRDNFRFINSYLQVMGPVIRQHGGFIDKYIGDAIMALFGEDADSALRAAIGMLKALHDYNTMRIQTSRSPIQIGIGLNSGDLMLGIIGEHGHMESTVISDAVNLASRVESLTKQYGISLLISEYTFYRLRNPGDYCLRVIDRVNVKGKSEPVTLWEVFDGDPELIRISKQKIIKPFETAVSLYYLNNFEEALNIFRECSLQLPEDRACQIYIQRCELCLSKK